MKSIIFAFLLLLAVNTQAQNNSPQFFNWHFGTQEAITFKTPDLEPISYRNSAMITRGGCASISDMDTNLLFYTNGHQVWDRFNKQMPNGFDLRGHQSSSQSALIVKKPGTDYLYYIFTVGVCNDFRNDNFCYSIVDMNANGGAGDVIEKNVPIHDRMVAEKQTAVMHRNGKDYWIIAHEGEHDNFVIALLTKNGIESVKVQKIGPEYYKTDTNLYVKRGNLKANIRGDRLAAVSYSQNEMQFFKFDRENGIIFDYLPISLDTNGYYGVEFSPSGQLLYVSFKKMRNHPQNKILIQFDINIYDRDSIEKSVEVIIESSRDDHSIGSLQIAPNGKIYFPHYSVVHWTIEYNLGVINKPDLRGTACEASKKALFLKNQQPSDGLPNYCVTKMLEYEGLELYGQDVCLNEDIEIEVEVFPNDLNYTYKWTGPNGFTSTLPIFKIEKAMLINEGYYVVETYQSGVFKMKDSIYIKVHPLPTVKIIGPKFICQPSFELLQVDSVKPGIEYLWSDSTVGTEIWVDQPGLYHVITTNSFGCRDTAYFNLKAGDLDVEILGALGICENGVTTLKANKSKAIDGRNYTYLWSTGDTTESITVSEAGEYSLQIIREGGCFGYDTVDVVNFPSPEIDFSHLGNLSICDESGIRLYVKAHDFNSTYVWDDGVVGSSRVVTTTGKYKLYVTNANLCIDSAEVEVKFGEKPDVEVEFSNDLNICSGDSVVVSVNFDTDKNSIKWNDGSTDLARTFYESGIFRCVVSNDIGCSDTTEFEIKVFDIDKPEIIADKIYVCEAGTPVTLSANQVYHEYLWSNGATTQSTVIDKQGIYKLIVSNEIGCSDSAEIEIFIMPMNKPEIVASKNFFCENDTLTLTANGDYATYQWSDGSTNSSIIVRNSGTYKVIVSNEIGCVDSAEIFIDAIQIAFEFTQNNYEGDIKCTGEESTIVLNLRNLTQTATIINELILENQIDFRVISPNLPFTLAADENREIIIVANSLVPGNFETSIKAISNEPCYFETSTNITQKFIQDISFSLPDIEAIAGEQLCIPIYGKINCGASPFVSSATIQISFDAEYFNPISLKSGANFTKVIENGICTVTIDYASLNLTETETMIDELCGVVLIGQPETTPLQLTYDDEASDFIEIESVDGSLKIEACAIEVRAVQYFTPTAMSVSPLPANDNLSVTIESGSIGTFELILVAFDGTQGVLKTWENMQSSSVDLLFDVSNLSQGVYSLLLKAPWSIHYQQILILR
ncbi:MAG: hypothetical protein CVV22_11460 [Ignavibacteriae bacterium HGW-Ignavibacteriae-1]|jgi:hypothetical protein|nr:MAG: hypothetical protein CVV22_11460 [Ignavibacteriae bacterium HGW-Ignavibacteriae-1]